MTVIMNAICRYELVIQNVRTMLLFHPSCLCHWTVLVICARCFIHDWVDFLAGNN